MTCTNPHWSSVMEVSGTGTLSAWTLAQPLFMVFIKVPAAKCIAYFQLAIAWMPDNPMLDCTVQNSITPLHSWRHTLGGWCSPLCEEHAQLVYIGHRHQLVYVGGVFLTTLRHDSELQNVICACIFIQCSRIQIVWTALSFTLQREVRRRYMCNNKLGQIPRIFSLRRSLAWDVSCYSLPYCT